MILLYTLTLATVGVAHWVLLRRAAGLGRAYTVRAGTVIKLLQNGSLKPGNANHNVCAHAKQQFELGQKVAQRDRVEAKWYAAQRRAERLGKLLEGMKAWKGKKLPYTMGVCDVWLVLYAIDRLGVGAVFGPTVVIDTVISWLSR